MSKCFNGGAGEVNHGLLGSSTSATALSRERQGHAYNISRRRQCKLGKLLCCRSGAESSADCTPTCNQLHKTALDREEELSLAGEEVVAYCV